MESKCEVVGWSIIDNAEHVFVREANGEISLQPVHSDSAFANQAIQTGKYRRGNPIVDAVTRETVGYEMELLSGGTAARV